MHWIDLTIITIYLTLIFSVGILMRNRISSFSSFMIADQKIPLSLGVTSMLGTELGLITVMYNAQTGTRDYFSAFHIGLMGFIVTLAVGLSGFVVVKLRNLNVKSIPEYYQKRFGHKTRLIGSILLVVGGMLNMGIFLNIGAKFIQGIFGFNSADDNILKLIMIVLLVMVLIYTMLGGMLSVIITDYFQFIVLSLGLIFCVFYSIWTIGWNNIFDSISNFPDKSYNPFLSKGNSYVAWQMILAFVSAVVWPTVITRALTMKNSETVRKQYLWSSISFLIRFMIPCFIGICAVIYLNPTTSENTLSLMPRYLKDVLPVGMLGLVTAGMLSAFMSTHDSYLLCWSTIITNDIIDPLVKKKLTSENKINISRIIILVLGLYILYWGLFYEGTDSIWDYLGITGAIYFSGAITVLIAGLYWKKASEIGAILALLGGLSAILGLEPIRRAFEINLLPEQIGLLSLVITVLMMITGSLIFPDKESYE